VLRQRIKTLPVSQAPRPAHSQSMMSPKDLSPKEPLNGIPLTENAAGRQTQENENAPPKPAECRPQNESEANKVNTHNRTQDLTQNRVCVTCRRRKVKCDKRNPCQNCVKARTECVFPSKRSVTEGQNAADTELLHELRRLEPLFQSLVSKINDEAVVEPSLQNSLALLESGPKRQPTTVAPPSLPTAIPCGSEGLANASTILDLPSLHGSPMTNNSVSGSEVVPWSPYGTTVGKLVKDSGRNRYVSGLFWDALHTEVRS
jgi:hypothetical protein